MVTGITSSSKSNRFDDDCKTQDAALSEMSERDKPWDSHRKDAQELENIYSSAREFERYAERVHQCSGLLFFGQAADPETGLLRLRLRKAEFCRVRHCPVCQWRRSLMWQARFHQSLPALQAEYPKARWMFLTLTVRNCPIGELRDMLKAMNDGWNRMRLRKEFKPVQGWIRTTEVTRSENGEAHPHFHALLMVPPSMFAKDYVPQKRWVELWRDCARLPYDPNVDVRTVKAKKGTDSKQALQDAATETLKYSVKPADMKADPDWFLELHRQVHRRRFVASGGVLKDVLKPEEETSEDLVLADEQSDNEDDGSRLAFSWRPSQQQYRRFVKGDRPPDKGDRNNGA